MSEDALVDEALAVTHQPLDHLRVFDIEAHAAPAVKDRGRDAATAAARGGTTGTTTTGMIVARQLCRKTRMTAITSRIASKSVCQTFSIERSKIGRASCRERV